MYVKNRDEMSRYNKKFMFQPGFKMNFKWAENNAHESTLRCCFVNGYEKKYILGGTPFSMILREI